MALLGMLALGPIATAGQHRTITPEDVTMWQQDAETFLFIDARQSHRYEYRHARGAINVPAFACASKNLPFDGPIVVYDDGTGSTECVRAADALAAKGHDVYILEGGLTAWEARRMPIVAVPGTRGDSLVGSVGVDDLLRLIDGPQNVAVFDVRPDRDFPHGRIPGARPTPSLANLMAAVQVHEPTDLIVVYDNGDGRAQKFAEKLRRRGYRAVKVVHGGMLAWHEKGFRVQK